ncbi:copper homeostasis protein CutC [Pseudonocardia kunmingensis]|uniref:PF03932 family protein CutC n=1 Tax=Pseudonocardia kunmingensis TaxID=630975 RepID=A0A543DJ47_9PSEU|nr:copper homeostasis protein CutC [Pseudonocardia kunmingensis]TQM09265.1 copper homeostasis protein [Pseudonocardia kunmingensis]
MTLALELAVQDVRGIRVAARVRPERIELCTALALGGLTPPVGLVDAAVAARDAGGPGVHVLVRPRTGGFTYDQDELAVLLADCRTVAERGADGIVVGATTTDADGTPVLDLDVIARAADAAGGGLDVTVHRVVDTLPDPVAAVDALVGTGVRRVLTSGGAAAAPDGVPVLRSMVAAAAGRLEVMAGSGVTPESVPTLAATGVDAVHGSASRVHAAEPGVHLGSSPEAGRFASTDPELARRLLAAVREVRS